MSQRSIVAHPSPHGPPGRLQLELATEAVEDAPEQAGWVHGERGVLHVSAGWRELLPRRSHAPGTASCVDAEVAFSWLIATSGATCRHAEIQHSAGAAAALPMVRELVYHLGFGPPGADS